MQSATVFLLTEHLAELDARAGRTAASPWAADRRIRRLAAFARSAAEAVRDLFAFVTAPERSEAPDETRVPVLRTYPYAQTH
jgi:hypothetical protein